MEVSLLSISCANVSELTEMLLHSSQFCTVSSSADAAMGISIVMTTTITTLWPIM